jgi:hypothetical protein
VSSPSPAASAAGAISVVFVGHFQGTYTQPGNSWDLGNCWCRTNETLQEYIQLFSKKRNELPNITNADVINALTCSTTCEVLIHTLRHEALRTMWELLGITTKYSTSEVAV